MHQVKGEKVSFVVGVKPNNVLTNTIIDNLPTEVQNILMNFLTS